jgi:hypothetical protein
MTNLSLRGIDEETATRLKTQARGQGMSVNAFLLRLIRQHVGLTTARSATRIYHDLDALAGTWSEQDTAQFLQAVANFDTIDPELWR